jgi:hypothetical protein
VHLDLDRAARRQAVGAKVRVGSRSVHCPDATGGAGPRKPQICW